MAQAEQYFAAEPQSKDVRRKLHVTLRGNEADVEVSNGVFSGNRVDLGTSVLLRQAPEPPEEGTFLDLGCGWGPIALTLGFESPKADIWALDVNERALELTRRNAELNGMGNIHAVTAEQVPAVLTFDLIWSNPPIRVENIYNFLNDTFIYYKRHSDIPFSIASKSASRGNDNACSLHKLHTKIHRRCIPFRYLRPNKHRSLTVLTSQPILRSPPHNVLLRDAYCRLCSSIKSSGPINAAIAAYCTG